MAAGDKGIEVLPAEAVQAAQRFRDTQEEVTTAVNRGAQYLQRTVDGLRGYQAGSMDDTAGKLADRLAPTAGAFERSGLTTTKGTDQLREDLTVAAKNHADADAEGAKAIADAHGRA